MAADGTERDRGSILNNVVGWCEWTLRNEDGSVAAQGEGKNTFTRVGRRHIPGYMGLPYFVALLDDEHPAGINEGLGSFKADQLSPSPIGNFGYSISGFIRTMTGSFSQPSAARTIRKIGLLGNEGSQAGVNEGGISQVSAYLELSPPIVQATNQTFEIVYRLALVVNPVKNLKRWQTWTPLDEANFATDIVNGGATTGNQHHYMHNVLGSNYFVDQASYHRGVGSTNGASNWTTEGGSTFSDGTVQRRGRDVTRLITHADNNAIVGGFGMCAGTWESVNANSYHSLVAGPRSYGFFPLVVYEGSISNVFKHPAGESYLFNVVGSVALSQGTVEVRGPYRPDEHRAPWHWGYHVVIEDAGDTDPGTEGTYTINKHGWHSYPYPSNYAAYDDYWSPSTCLSDYIVDTAAVGATTTKHQQLFDGIDTYWAATANGNASARLLRWRAGTNEQIHQNVVGDLTRFYGFDPPGTGTASYSLATDGAGIVWMMVGHTTLALQTIFKIDNTKPGRWYQRPSAIVASGAPQTLTVDAADEIHAMFPFVAGDVGKKIRLFNTLNNGTDSVRTITAYNGPNSVDVDGPAFVTEGGMLWHHVTVTKLATGMLTGTTTQGNFEYDAANGRMWQLTTAGLEFSLDGGVTWTTINTGNGLTTALATPARQQNGDDQQRVFVIGNGGKLYWIDANNAVNKYTPVPVTVVSGTHERVTNAALPSFANGFTKGTLVSLGYDPAGCDQTTHTDGVLWLGQDRVFQRGFWRLACGPTFVSGGATAYDNYTIRGGTFNDYLDHSAQTFIAMPEGRVLMVNATRNQWMTAEYNQTTGALVFTTQGGIWNGDSSRFWGPIVVRPNGLVCGFGAGVNDKNYGGQFVGFYQRYRYDDLLTTWVPWAGSSAQFNSRYGTTNGGKRKCHASWEKVLGSGKSDNIQIRFVQNGTVAPTDEYKAAERFTFVAAYGVFRTNVQDVTWRHDYALANTEAKVETEAIKTVTGRGSIQVFYIRSSSVFPSPGTLGTTVPALDNAGINFGWLPAQSHLALSGGGDIPNTNTGYGPTSFSAFRAGIDFGAAPPAISRLRTLWYDGQYYQWQRYHRTGADRGRMRVYFSDDNAAWTEVPEVRFQLNGVSQPDAGYKYVYFTEYPYGGSISENSAPHSVIFDLEAAGLSALARTHRYWQIIIGSNDGGNSLNTPYFYGLWGEDASSNPVGFGVNHRTDEAHDPDHGASWIYNFDFIQTRTGLSGQGGINTVDDGDANGFTDIVTIASGSFDTGLISTVTDFLAWKESPGVGNGYVRRPYGETGRGLPWSLGYQARARIIFRDATTIQVSSPIIPDNLAAVDFEIRRPTTSAPFTTGSSPRYDLQNGYLQFHDTDIGREFRITRKAIIRLP